VCSRLDQQDSLPRPPQVSSVPCEAISIADDKKLKLVPTVVCRRLKLSTRQAKKRPPHLKRLKVVTMVTWTDQCNEAIVRHALGSQDASNIYVWRSLLRRRPELFGQCTSKQLRERAVQIAKSLIDVAFKRKFQKELRQLKQKMRQSFILLAFSLYMYIFVNSVYILLIFFYIYIYVEDGLR